MMSIGRAVGNTFVNTDQLIYGKSTDVKPIDTLPNIDDRLLNGAMLCEMDTGKVFLFDAEESVWIDQSFPTP